MDATELCFAGAAEQARLVAAGEVSARELVEATLARIAQQQPRLNAYRVVLGEQALAEADAVDAGPGEGVLRGVPVAIKDNVDVAGEVTAMGTAGHGPAKARDAEVVRRLRAAGAIVIGKTHVPELMMIPATDSTTYGATRNPWDVARTAGGSSGGSAAAAAAGLCGVALGSDGAGSIREPAAWNALVGLKPQRDRVPVAPHDDGWQGMSVNGPLARRAVDAALFMDAADPGHDFAAAVAAGPQRRLRVAVSTKAPLGARFRLGREERAALDATAQRLRALGHEVAEHDPDYAPSLWGSAYTRVLRGISDDLDHEIVHPERLEARTRSAAALGRRLPDALVARARAAERGQAARLAALFDHFDVLMTPACADGPYPAGVMGRRGFGAWMATASERIPYLAAFNLTGQPAISVPAGRDDDDLPVGVQLVARSGDDTTLLALAGELERDGALEPATAARMNRADELLDVAVEAARAAAAVLVTHRDAGARSVATKSSPTDMVSAADIAAEAAIRDVLERRRPDDAILGEEGEDRHGTSGLRWVVDPLDGTTNFLFGNPQWSVSVACEGHAAAILDPERGELFTVVEGGPAFLGEHRLGPPRARELATALVATGFGYEARVRAAQATIAARVLPRVRDLRRAGSAALDLAWAAAGRVDAYWEYGVRAWDTAAGLMLCTAAGLEARTLEGDGALPPGVLVAPPAIVDELEALVR